jgi:tetrahedral aminopeptidase
MPNWELLKELCTSSGVSGREERLRALVRRELESLADEVRTDTLGNVVAFRRGAGRGKLMLAAHTDEIGFLATHVDNRGFIRFAGVGGHDPRRMVSQLVTVCGTRDLPGVMMPVGRPPHLLTDDERNRPYKLEQFFVDVGLPADEVKEIVKVGTPIVTRREFQEVGNNVVCKAMDDRASIFVMLEAMRAAGRSDWDLYAVATSQEEVGLRGATTAAFQVEPDVAVALDVTIADDIPDASEEGAVTRLGDGVGIKIMDSSSISHPLLVEHFEEIARQREIRHQREILPRGGTDAGALQRSRAGCPAITLSIPCRYVHSTVEMCARADIEATIDLLAAYISEGPSRSYAWE